VRNGGTRSWSDYLTEHRGRNSDAVPHFYAGSAKVYAIKLALCNCGIGALYRANESLRIISRARPGCYEIPRSFLVFFMRPMILALKPQSNKFKRAKRDETERSSARAREREREREGASRGC